LPAIFQNSRLIVLHFEHFRCDDRGSLCTQAGCLHQIYVSTGGRYRLSRSYYAQAINRLRAATRHSRDRSKLTGGATAARAVSVARGEPNACQEVVGLVVEADTGSHVQLKVRSDEVNQSSDSVMSWSG
jgi:hypothetical protein